MSENKSSESQSKETCEPVLPEKNKVKGAKGKKAGKTKKTTKVVVRMPTINRRFDDDHKLFSRRIGGMKGTLEQINEESKDKMTDQAVIDESSDHDNKENDKESQRVSAQHSAGSEKENKNNGTNKTEHIYGTFIRSNTERSFFNTRSNTENSMVSKGRKSSINSPRRPKSSQKWSKKDIELFLPRKSFFSVHDKTLSAAGFHINSDEERKIPEWRSILRMRTQDELYPPEDKDEDTHVSMFGLMDDDSDDDDPYGLENVETAMSAGKDGAGTKPRRRQKEKKLTNAEKEEYKPLYDYLKYIHDNPEEYIQTHKYVGKNIDHKHPNTMVRLGRAFRRGHHGAYKNSIYLHAITDLKKKVSETADLRQTKPDKSSTKKEGADTAEQANNPEETEIEKLKSKAEKWAKGLTTQQWLKARDLALKDVGDEDVNTSKWWLVFKSCHYLRIPSHMRETTH